MSGVMEILMSAAILSTADLRREFPVAPRDAAVVQDAIERWTKKLRGRSDMENRIPIVVYLSKQRCVVLRLRSTEVGGNPAYCYRVEEDALIEAFEDVE